MPNRPNQKIKLRWDRIIGVIVIFVAIISLIIFGISKCGKENVDRPKNPPAKSDGKTTTTQPTEPLPDLGEQVVKISQSDLNKGNLIVANSQYMYQGTPAVVSIQEKKNIHFFTAFSDLTCTEETILAFNELTSAYYAENQAEDIRIISAYDTSTKTADGITGLSIKIGIVFSDGVYNAYAYDPDDEKVYNWITKYAHNYGFVTRYPKNKTGVTGVESSDSIFRYVGIPHATYMYQNSLCLEEYIELVKTHTKNNPLIITTAPVNSTTTDTSSTATAPLTTPSKTYQVFYLPSAGATTEFSIPASASYTVSGDNMSGFVVTVAL
jgi:D-alanyl-D-alanine carboxypeptidase